ncbi:HipA domain-containing protein [Luteimonas sp. RC10]|uniref:type II toxin-antitoxin system HipA family toxin n=1 Tax=Luteimonas sp. RC10 TaxID=2587035 RepID=UPI001618E70D|nr:HipA domain-containing protein [Luteimonas sp. RC10]MBB3342737.1 serine/threonine-protein kinase HipA [Luteimonas sp. RC10]
MSPAPSDTHAIVRIEVWLDAAGLGGATLVGHLARLPSRTGDTIQFQYVDDWVDGTAPIRSFALDPQLPLHRGPHVARAGAGTLTAAFTDCSPDRWGKRLMDRREVIDAREQNRRVRALRPWDYLIGTHDASRMGALRLRETNGPYLDDRELSAPPMTELRALEAIAVRVERDDIDDSELDARWIRQLVAPGASLGGARPKASVRDVDQTLWLAKFPSSDDRHDVGLWEYVTSRLADAAGIDMPQARPLSLSGLGTTYTVRRFDRSGVDRHAYASALTLLDADDSEDISYVEIAHAIENHGVASAIADDLAQLYRRAVFNVLVGNRDDHLRNHGFLRAADGWRLAPAFDVNPNPDKDAHVLSIGLDDPTPDTRLLLDTCAYYRLSKSRAHAIVEEVRAAVRGWKDEARRCKARGVEIAAMEAVIDPER